MLTLSNVKVFGIIDALRGMRNPLNSWDRNDSTCRCSPEDGRVVELKIGPNDERLCRSLCLGGQPHRKFLRQIPVEMDITAPSYWWAEMDTYKVGTTRSSCSVQHKGAARDFVLQDFTIDGVDPEIRVEPGMEPMFEDVAKDAKDVLNIVNKWRRRYAATKDYTCFRIMRQFLPSGYNYRTTWSANYETLVNIYHWRKSHKLVEWKVFCEKVAELPGMDIFLGQERGEK